MGTLARIIDNNGNVPPGSKGLSLFYVELRDPLNSDKNSGLNGLQVQRLKNKLGTKQLPTGELVLDGTKAQLVGEPSQGVKLISNMLTITRIHNSVASTSNMRRVCNLAADYSRKRNVFGHKLQDHCLHMHTLANMEVTTRACTLFVFDVCRLLGLSESRNNVQNIDEDEVNLLRLLTPVCKLFTAKEAISVISEGLESFGGAGYLEDTDIPRILRDAQVGSIWEGTTNVLALDVYRAIGKSGGQVLNSFHRQVNSRLDKIRRNIKISQKKLGKCVTKVQIGIGDLRAFTANSQQLNPINKHAAAREFSFSIAHIYCSVLLLEQATSEEASQADIYSAVKWCTQKNLCPVASLLNSGAYYDESLHSNKVLVMDNLTN